MLHLIFLLVLTAVKGQQWPEDSSARCTHTSKQTAMYGRFAFQPPLSIKPMTSFEVDIKWDELKFNPISNPHKRGGVYISYTTQVTGGPPGYFGIQIVNNGGNFIFSFWDGDRFTGKGHDKEPKKSSKLVWPINMKNCQRNCQDCGLPQLRELAKKGFTTGTKCFVKYPNMRVGDRYKIGFRRKSKEFTINTADYGGMPKSHSIVDEYDREVTGGLWEMYVEDVDRESRHLVGQMLMEGDGNGMKYIRTFDEMLGCVKCNAIQHKDTRYGPYIGGDGIPVRKPLKMEGLTITGHTTCKKSFISGEKDDMSISFEAGPFTTKTFPQDGKKYQKVW
ncbi:uncharacterized protein [Clytia hemisphaerica]|eukprot:TCONS_00026642-protein